MRKALLVLAVLALVFSSISPVFAEDVTVTGMVEKTDAGMVLKAEDGEYALTGADVAAHVGKKVEAVGTVTEADGKKTLEVKSAKAVE